MKESLFVALVVAVMLLLTASGNAMVMMIGAALLLVIGLIWFARSRWRSALLVALAGLGVAGAVVLLLGGKSPKPAPIARSTTRPADAVTPERGRSPELELSPERDYFLTYAWEVGYNLTTNLSSLESRWQLLQAAIAKLRDEGLQAFPNDLRIHHELAWLFQHRLGLRQVGEDALGLGFRTNPMEMDADQAFYRKQWATQMEALFPQGRPASEPPPAYTAASSLKERFRMDLAFVREVDAEYGPLDWRLPESHAIYWAAAGLRAAATATNSIDPDQLTALRRVIDQSRQMISLLGRLRNPSAAVPTKTIVLTRETNQPLQAPLDASELFPLPSSNTTTHPPGPVIDPRTGLPMRERGQPNPLVAARAGLRIVSVWSDATVLPGEKLRALVKRPDGEMTAAQSLLFTTVEAGKTRTSSSFSWFLKEADGFGAAEADMATAQIRGRFTQRPLVLKAFTPLELFCVTNRQGGTLAGYIQFEQFNPQPPNVTGPVKARVQIQQTFGFSPMIGYSATVTAGYALRATASEGMAHTHTPARPYLYNSSWHPGFLPGRLPTPLRELTWHVPHADNALPFLPQRALHGPANVAGAAAQIESRAPVQPQPDSFDVVLGEPKLIFSITNGPGDVFHGFLELVGPAADAPK